MAPAGGRRNQTFRHCDEKEENLCQLRLKLSKIETSLSMKKKTDATQVDLVKSGVKEEQGKLIAEHELWRKSITLGSKLCSTRASLGG